MRPDPTAFRTLLARGAHRTHMAPEPATTDSLAREATALGFGFFFDA
ncbi:hypothetical protein [Haloplanus halophilus]|nr:hypothetical protein [Haloplanus sp. GDY1]